MPAEETILWVGPLAALFPERWAVSIDAVLPSANISGPETRRIAFTTKEWERFLRRHAASFPECEAVAALQELPVVYLHASHFAAVGGPTGAARFPSAFCPQRILAESLFDEVGALIKESSSETGEEDSVLRSLMFLSVVATEVPIPLWVVHGALEAAENRLRVRAA